MVLIMKDTAYMWEYKVGINAIIVKFVCLWKKVNSSKSFQIIDFIE